ncbi:EF-hand domain-containing protein [uncultured Massilia sp.]|uniref:EF-hand domain-containing protein n=1 Tax=uncultured Massilia sp. TaxID=169973 RepID=UPI0025EE09DE|nr:EF-hand domain-containing protein [uncultured Massilia sp.]
MRIQTSLVAGLLAAALCAPSPGALAQPSGQPGRQFARMLDNVADADANQDGRIVREEWTAWRAARFARMDRNHDGQLSADDIPAMLRGGRQGAQFDQLVRALDANGDGRLDRDEFVAGTRLFDWLDADRDGVIDAAALRRARDAAK